MNLRLDFAGGLALWQGLIVGVLAALVIWRWYRRDVRRIAKRWARVVLPATRAAVLFALLAGLTGPVLTHRIQEGQLGRVLVFVDGSQSMGLTDEHLDTGRKLLIAASRGASADGIDLRLAKLERGLGDLSQTAAKLDSPSAASTREERIEHLLAELNTAAGQLSELDPAHLPPTDPQRGSITAEYFDDLPGTRLDDLTSSPRFKQAPSKKEARDLFESSPNRGDNYGTRMRGLLYAPLTGVYTFWLNSDDDSVLFISPDTDPLKKKPIARVDGFTPYHQWENMPSQKSALIQLVAAKNYYVEALHKEGSGEDFVCVGWDRPDGKQERPIPGIYLSSWERPAQDGPAALAKLRQDFDNELIKPARRLLQEAGGNGRASSPAELASLTDALRRWQGRSGAAFAAYAQGILESGDAKLRQSIDEFNRETRWHRAESLLLNADRGFLPALVETHHVELMTLAGRDTKRSWDSALPGHQPEALPGAPDAAVTDLSDGIRNCAGEGADRMAVVLLSDGRHNAGASPLELARFLGARGVPLHAIGLGNPSEPPDLAVLEVQGPQAVYADDRVKGHVVLKDSMPPGLSFTLSLSNKGRELWKHELITDGSGLRKIEYDFAAKNALTARTVVDQDVQVLAEPVALQAVVSPVDGESRRDNNSVVQRMLVTRQRRQILLLDGRPRWEMRFIRDLFDRDHQWRLDPLIQDVGADGPSWSKVDGPGRFPPDRESLYAYGMIILGELPPGTLRKEELEWIRDFVEKRGGGLILIDGQRGNLREYESTPLGPLIPIGPAESFGRPNPDHLELTAPGRQLAALRLDNESEANATLWRALPGPHWIAPVRALEGAEVLAEAVCRDQRRVPLLVHRQVGAGQVLYCASDETWRWRYDVADRYQTRYWNQIANWLMEAPFAVKDRFVAIDAGGPAYHSDETARVRVQLSDRAGKPLANAHGEVAIYREGTKVAAVPLEPDASRPGLYRAVSPSLPEGEYEAGVAVDGYSELETKARASFAVEARRGTELANLSCDEELLKAMAAESGGTYLREEEAGRLPALLKPLSAGRVVVTQTRLAESYWWFVPVMLLLTVEWVVRKRIGLI